MESVQPPSLSLIVVNASDRTQLPCPSSLQTCLNSLPLHAASTRIELSTPPRASSDLQNLASCAAHLVIAQRCNQIWKALLEALQQEEHILAFWDPRCVSTVSKRWVERRADSKGGIFGPFHFA